MTLSEHLRRLQEHAARDAVLVTTAELAVLLQKAEQLEAAIDRALEFKTKLDVGGARDWAYELKSILTPHQSSPMVAAKTPVTVGAP